MFPSCHTGVIGCCCCYCFHQKPLKCCFRISSGRHPVRSRQSNDCVYHSFHVFDLHLHPLFPLPPSPLYMFYFCFFAQSFLISSLFPSLSLHSSPQSYHSSRPTPSGPGEGELAAAHYQQAVKLKPAHYVAMVNLGRLLRSSNENKEAESWYKRWVKYHNLAAVWNCRAADEEMTSAQKDKGEKKNTGCYCFVMFHSFHKRWEGHEQNFQTEKEHYCISKSPSNHMGNKIVNEHKPISKSVCSMRKFTV